MLSDILSKILILKLECKVYIKKYYSIYEHWFLWKGDTSYK